MESSEEVERISQVYQQRASTLDIAKRYDLSNRGNQIMYDERYRMITKLLIKANLSSLCDKKILDVGCGTGTLFQYFIDRGAKPDDLYGVDLLEERVMMAREQYPKSHVLHGNAEDLPWADQSFDIVSLLTVFSSILDQKMAKQVALEISRVLKTDGKVLWYDLRYDNPYNTDVRAISIHEIHELFPHFTLDVKKITLLPMISRKLGKWADLVYPALYQLSFLRTHYVALFTKQSDVHVNRDFSVKNS